MLALAKCKQGVVYMSKNIPARTSQKIYQVVARIENKQNSNTH